MLPGCSTTQITPACSLAFQREQEQLGVRQRELDRQLAAMDDTVDNVWKWMDLITKYADLKQLDAPIINELIEKIEI